MHWTQLPADVLALLRRGAVIPAHPLALDAARRLDPRRQRALTRYYIDAGAGGTVVFSAKAPVEIMPSARTMAAVVFVFMGGG